MADERHLYVVAQGGYTDAGLSNEIWQVGIRCYAAPGGTPDPLGTLSNAWSPVATTVARTETNWRIDGNWRVEGGINDLDVGDYLNDTLAPSFATWMGQAAISQVVRLDAIKVYPIIAPLGIVEPATPYATGTPVTLTWTSSNPVGGGGATPMGLQVSLVQSHRTSQIGRKGRGRMFLPPSPTGAMSTGSGSAGRVASGYVTGSNAAQVALLEAIALNISDDGFWVVPSIIGSPWNAYAFISSVQTGDVFDTQRRRRNALDETYTTTAVTY